MYIQIWITIWHAYITFDPCGHRRMVLLLDIEKTHFPEGPCWWFRSHACAQCEFQNPYIRWSNLRTFQDLSKAQVLVADCFNCYMWSRIVYDQMICMNHPNASADPAGAFRQHSLAHPKTYFDRTMANVNAKIFYTCVIPCGFHLQRFEKKMRSRSFVVTYNDRHLFRHWRSAFAEKATSLRRCKCQTQLK